MAKGGIYPFQTKKDKGLRPKHSEKFIIIGFLPCLKA